MAAPPPSVVFNDRCLLRPRTGVGQYAYQLLRALRAFDEGDCRVVPFFFTHFARRSIDAPPPVPLQGGAVLGRRSPWFVRRTLQAGYAAVFNAVSAAKGYELYHEPNHIPLRWYGPTVTTIHDLSGVCHPEWHPADRVKWYETQFGRTLEQTVHYVAVSHFTAREMVRELGIAPQKITVCYQAPRSQFHPRSPGAVDAVLRRHNIDRPYFLFVGTLEPRKNLPRIVQAYASLPASVQRRFLLVVAGGLGWSFNEVLDSLRADHVRASIRLTGFVDDESLACLYTGCRALVWPSLYEGFGLPPLECMACGNPALVSNVTSLPEVVGDAGLRVNPYDVDAIAAAMAWLAEDDLLIERLRKRSAKRLERYSWRACAADHVRAYMRALS